MTASFIALIVGTFMLGTTIFYVLSCLERSVLRLAFFPAPHTVNESDVRFVHQSLKRLIPLLPPSNGFVLVVGTGFLIYQCTHRDWDIASVSILAYYWLIQLFIFLVLGVAGAIREVRDTPSDGERSAVTHGVKRLVLAHHAGLLQNLGVVVLEFMLIAR